MRRFPPSKSSRCSRGTAASRSCSRIYPNELSSAERLLQFEELTHIGLNYVLDTGHAHMHEGIERAFNLMKDRIRSTHIHDNNGQDDKHLWPLLQPGGGIDWEKTMTLLRSREEQYPLLLELKEQPEFAAHPLDAILEVFDKLEELPREK